MVEFERQELQDFLEAKRSRKAESTIQNYQAGLTRFDSFLVSRDMTVEDVGVREADTFLGMMNRNVSDGTAGQYLTAVNKFYEWYYMGQDVQNPIEEVDTSDLDRTSNRHDKPALEQSELRNLVESAQSKRAEALLSVMASTGMRVREACECTISKLNLDERYMEIQTVKNDFGERTAYFDRKTRRVLNEYLNHGFRAEYEHTDSDYVFLSKAYGQHESNQHLSTDRARVDFRTAVKESDIEPEIEEYSDGRERWTITTHILRRSFCQHWFREDGDIMSLRNQVGWENLESAKAYLPDEATLEKRDRFGVDL